MEWLIIIGSCLLGGWWLFSMILGGTDEASKAIGDNPKRGAFGIAVFAIIVFIAPVVIGTLIGK